MFTHRTEAGQQLAQKLSAHPPYLNGLILALPRGGVPVADEIAQALHLPLACIIHEHLFKSRESLTPKRA